MPSGHENAREPSRSAPRRRHPHGRRLSRRSTLARGLAAADRLHSVRRTWRRFVLRLIRLAYRRTPVARAREVWQRPDHPLHLPSRLANRAAVSGGIGYLLRRRFRDAPRTIRLGVPALPPKLLPEHFLLPHQLVALR